MKHKENLPRIVLDTCVYIHYLANQNKTVAENVEGLLAVNNQDHEILLPAIVQAETIGIARVEIPKAKNTVTQRQKAANKAVLFFERAALPLVEHDQFITEKASELIVEHDIRGADAMILASAVCHNATHLYTVDGGLLKIGNQIPGLEVCEPPQTTTLSLDLSGNQSARD